MRLEDAFDKHGEMVQIGKISYKKTIAVVYNPNSGKKRNVRLEIMAVFSERN
jgi:hypothetical protein